MKINSIFSLSILLVVISLNALQTYAQTVEIIYDENHRNKFVANISFSDQSGFKNPDVRDVVNSGYIYFVIETTDRSRRDHFRQRDIDNELFEIKLVQDGNVIPRAIPLTGINGHSRFFRQVTVGFDKNNLSLHKPFYFTKNSRSTASMDIDEKYWTHYHKYQEKYDRAMSLQNEKNYIGAFDELIKILTDAKEIPEINHYSFFEDASTTRIQTLIKNYAVKQKKNYDLISDEFSINLDSSLLLQADSLQNLIERKLLHFDTYFDLDYQGSGQVRTIYKETLADIDAIKSDNLETFRDRNMHFFASNTYNNGKFTDFIDAITRLLLHIDNYQRLSDLDTINLNAMERIPQTKKNFKNLEWYDEFALKISLINQNIINHQTIFDNDIMESLGGRLAYQPQPYYEIITAFNSKGKNDLYGFYENLRKAITACSDPLMIQDIEKWRWSYLFTIRRLPESNISEINEGVGFINAGSWGEADQAFRTIIRKIDDYAVPWYYGAMIDLNQKNIFAAKIKLENSISRYEEYVSPRLEYFKYLYENEMFKELLEETTKALESLEIYIFHFWRAKALLANGNSEKAIAEIEQHCHRINPHDIYSWFLLGDAYKAIKNYRKAREMYLHTQEMNPLDYSVPFNEKMKNLPNIAN